MRKFMRFLALVLLSIQLDARENSHCDFRSDQALYTPIVSDVFEPTAAVLGSDHNYHLIYGLKLTNASGLPAEIKKVEVLKESDHSVLRSFEKGALNFTLVHLNGQGAVDTRLERDASRIFFVHLKFSEKSSIPNALVHRLSVNGAAGPGSRAPSSLTYVTTGFCVPREKPQVISPPLRGEGYVVFNGCCSFQGAHQDALLPLNGSIYNAQRFAIDFMKLGKQDRLYEGDPSNPSNWFCYDEEIYAISDGVVVSVLDGLPDQPPGSLPDPESLTAETVTGNHVILKLDQDLYAFYAHLRRGSIQVQKGDRVLKGQKIARLGNSGNTSAPHLHLHLMSGPLPVGSSPIPYVYDAFELAGKVEESVFYDSEDLSARFGNRGEFTPQRRVNQLPMDLSILNF